MNHPKRVRLVEVGPRDGLQNEAKPVPVADIKRLLKEKPAVAGLSVPGMPIGSPGMEVRGVASQPYKVLAFTPDGKTRVFSSY